MTGRPRNQGELIFANAAALCDAFCTNRKRPVHLTFPPESGPLRTGIFHQLVKQYPELSEDDLDEAGDIYYETLDVQNVLLMLLSVARRLDPMAALEVAIKQKRLGNGP